MKKRIVQIALLATVLLALLAVCTACKNGSGGKDLDKSTFVKGTEGLEYTLFGNSYIASGIGTAAETDIVIASHYEGVPVTGIFSEAFKDCTNLTGVTIPDTVKLIGDEAFNNCLGLTSVTIGNRVTSIGDSAFRDCSSLNAITIPDSVTSIGDYAFNKCRALTDVTLGNGVTSIGYDAFQNCSGLESIQVAEENPIYYASGNCLIETASKTLIIGCKNSIIPADGSVTSIGSSAFEDSIGLTSIEIPDSITSIGGEAFRGCSNLTSITIPNSVMSVGNGAFEDCVALTSITIPNSVKSIGYKAFSTGGSLTDITFTGTKAEWEAIKKNMYWNTNTAPYTIHCTDGDIAKS